MASLWIIFAVLHIISLIIGVVSIRRLYGYIRRYRFDESKYTLLFSFVHLHWIVTLYVAVIILWIPISLRIFSLF